MREFRHFGAWMVAVVRHAYGWVGGTLLSVVLLVGQVFWGWQPSRWHFVLLLGLGLFWSMFAAWRDEHDARLKAEVQRAGRPSIAPRSYKKREDERVGMTVTNSGYDAYDVHIPDAPIADSGYVLKFEGIFAQLVHKEQAFFETWIENLNALPGRGGGDLFAVMQKASVRFVYFGILSKDTSPAPHWYRDNCSIECDSNKRRDGLVLKHIDQEEVPAPMQPA